MANNFSFDRSKSFDENFKAFLVTANEIDEDFADILRNNTTSLAQIVREGERDSNTRISEITPKNPETSARYCLNLLEERGRFAVEIPKNVIEEVIRKQQIFSGAIEG